MESAIYFISAVLVCGSPLFLGIVGLLSGLLGGKVSSVVLGKLDPEIPKKTHAKIGHGSF